MRTFPSLLMMAVFSLAIAGCAQEDPLRFAAAYDEGTPLPQVVAENETGKSITVKLLGPLNPENLLEGGKEWVLTVPAGETKTREVVPGRYSYDAISPEARGTAGYVDLKPGQKYTMVFNAD
jgi:predicted small lipoprotein YifL